MYTFAIYIFKCLSKMPKCILNAWLKRKTCLHNSKQIFMNVSGKIQKKKI